MPLHEEEGRLSRGDLQELCRFNNCLECGGPLGVFLDLEAHLAFMACQNWTRSHHEGFTREPSRFEKGGLSELTIERRRDIMVQDIGAQRTTALEQYANTGVASPMTKAIATEIVNTLWGNAPLIEKQKCILLCQTYQLNPLMKHLYLVGYKRNAGGKPVVDGNGQPVLDWSIQIGIGATRLMAQRKHNYSYLDFTPRLASEEEINKILGKTADPGSIYGFVHIRDQASGAEAFGLRGIKTTDSIKGAEKGNTHLNMACIRAERLALDRQYPGEMPASLEVFDERYIETEYKIVNGKTGEITEQGQDDAEPGVEETGNGEVHFCQEHNCAYALKTGKGGSGFWSHKTGTGWCNEKKAKKQEEVPSPETGEQTTEPPASLIDMDWLAESLTKLAGTGLAGWSDTDVRGYMATMYKVEADTALEGVKKLDKGAAAHFVQRVQDTLDMA